MSTCPITELPTNQCGCPTHHQAETTIISAAALERLAGRRMPEVRYRRRTLAEAAWQHYAEHGPQTWHCPLCDFSTTAPLLKLTPAITRHATSSHPAHLPEKLTVADMLDLLPVLIREAVATIDAPNPDGPAGQRKTASEPAPFRQIRLLRAANATSESSLFADLVSCSRIIWAAFDDVAKSQHPQPEGVSWALELAWFAAAWADAQAYLAGDDIAWISNEIRTILGSFAAFAKVRRRPKYLCPTDGCNEQMHLADDGWLTCGAGHQHPGPQRLEREWRRKPPMSTKDICSKLRVPRRTLMWWQANRGLNPTRTEGRESYWLPWDVIALRYPDIVAEIDERDTAQEVTPM